MCVYGRSSEEREKERVRAIMRGCGGRRKMGLWKRIAQTDQSGPHSFPLLGKAGLMKKERHFQAEQCGWQVKTWCT
jgi:hypothetical protein